MALPFDFRNPQPPEPGGALAFKFTSAAGIQHISVYGFDAASMGQMLVRPHVVFGAGFDASGIGWPVVGYVPVAPNPLLFRFERAFDAPAGYNLHYHFTPPGPSTQVLNPYPIGPAPFGLARVQYSPYIRVQGYVATEWGNALVINKSDLQQSIAPQGFVATQSALPAIGRALRFKFDNPAYVIPPGAAVAFDFVLQGGTQGVYASLGVQTEFGQAQVGTSNQDVRPAGFNSSAFGALRASPQWVVRPAGFLAQVFSNPVTWNRTQIRQVQGFTATLIGTATIWNWRQYRAIQGFNTAAFGTPAVLGGVKYVVPGGIAAPTVPNPLVVNTKATRTLQPTGFNSLALGSPNVSPRFLLPVGILGLGMGTPVVQRNPSPAGWQSSRFGTPFIYDKSRYIRPAGIFQSDAGFPRVADKAQRILHIASPVSSVFGDTSVRLVNMRVKLEGFDGLAFSPWAEVRNRNRFLEPLSIAAGAMGSVSLWQTPSFTPHGFVATRFGTHDVGWRVRRVYPAGIPALVGAVPAPSLWQTPALKPQGISAPTVPAPMVQNAKRYLEASGSPLALYGKPMVGYRYRHVAPDGYAGSAYGTPRLEHRDRTLLAQSFTQAVYGTPLLTMARRFLEPIGIKPVEYGANHMIGGTRYVQPIGYEATRWGSRIIPEAQVLAPLGFADTFGWPKLENKNQHVAPASIRLYSEPQQYFGLNRVFNSRQYVTMFYDPDSELNPPRWPQWTLIENRNKRMGVTGWVAGTVPAPRIENKARVLLPGGVAAPALPVWQKTGMVAYRVRPLRLDGLEPPYISSWSNVHNVARLLKPSGIAAASFGLAVVENRSREFKRIGGFDSAWFGYPFVAPRIRELTFEGRYTIGPPRIDLPKVQLHSRYVEPRGIANPEVGAAAVEIHWNRIQPRWTLQNLYGFPVVKNLTPELRTRGYAMDEWGDTRVRLQWRPVAPSGERMELFGRAIIADSRRFITVAGTNMLRIGDKLTVTKTGVPPLATQYIYLDSLDPIDQPDRGHGIAPPNWPQSQLGTPHMQQQVIYPASVRPMTLWGTPTVTANSIRVEPGIFDLTVGEPTVSLKRRFMAASTLQGSTSFGHPRLSPHTIYAVLEAPAQAVANHPPRDVHPVRSWVEFGIPEVQNRHRRMFQYFSHEGMALGSHAIHNARQYVYPVGRLMSRMGWPSLPGETRVEFYTTIDTMVMGYPTVGRPPYVGPQYVAPWGLMATGFGIGRVEHRNRTMHAVGHDSAQLGGPRWLDTPFMWQGLRVGALVPNIPQGFNAEAFGKGWISHRVRQLSAEGFDAFRSEYDYQSFAQRMRVRNASRVERLPQIVKAIGQHQGAMGVPGVRLGVHYIRPDGNSDQYRKGVPA